MDAPADEPVDDVVEVGVEEVGPGAAAAAVVLEPASPWVEAAGGVVAVVCVPPGAGHPGGVPVLPSAWKNRSSSVHAVVVETSHVPSTDTAKPWLSGSRALPFGPRMS